MRKKLAGKKKNKNMGSVGLDKGFGTKRGQGEQKGKEEKKLAVHNQKGREGGGVCQTLT